MHRGSCVAWLIFLCLQDGSDARPASTRLSHETKYRSGLSKARWSPSTHRPATPREAGRLRSNPPSPAVAPDRRSQRQPSAPPTIRPSATAWGRVFARVIHTARPALIVPATRMSSHSAGRVVRHQQAEGHAPVARQHQIEEGQQLDARRQRRSRRQGCRLGGLFDGEGGVRAQRARRDDTARLARHQARTRSRGAPGLIDQAQRRTPRPPACLGWRGRLIIRPETSDQPAFTPQASTPTAAARSASPARSPPCPPESLATGR